MGLLLYWWTVKRCSKKKGQQRMIIKNYYTGPLAVNCYVVTDEKTKKTFMVDPGGHNTEMVNYIKNNNLELEYIILTHGHGDHMGGVSPI